MQLSWHYRPAWTQLGLQENLVGIEIGVDKGINALHILSNLNINKLYLIDPYFLQDEEFNDDGERSYRNIVGENEKTRIGAEKLISEFKDVIEWKIGTTEKEIDKIPDNYVDFCYIDGCHEYEFVKKDIELCLPKVKVGGVIGGHDFCPDHQGVVKAVMEMFDRNKIFVGNRDWWVYVCH